MRPANHCTPWPINKQTSKGGIEVFILILSTHPSLSNLTCTLDLILYSLSNTYNLDTSHHLASSTPHPPLCHTHHCATLTTVPQSPLCHTHHCATLTTVSHSLLCHTRHCATPDTVPHSPFISTTQFAFKSSSQTHHVTSSVYPSTLLLRKDVNAYS